jgi:multiple sugar transport system substrate-binding protein
MKKLIVAITMVCALVTFAHARGKEEAAVPSAEQPTTVQYAFWGNPDAIGVEEDIINAFEAKNPSIKIEPVVSGYGEYHTKLLTMIAGGAAPDVMRISSQFFLDFLKAGALREISDLVKKANIDLEAYYRAGIDENSHEGKLYGLPWGTAPLYMLLNLKMFKAAGLSPPPLNWDWNEFVRLIKNLTKGSGADKQYGFALVIGSDLFPIFPFVWQNGGNLFDASRKKFTLDQPEAYEAIQRLADLYQQGYMPQEMMNMAAHSTAPRWFVNDKLAMYQGTASEILTIQNVEGTEFEAWTMPNGENRRTTVVKSNTIGISPGTKKLDAAWTFVEFLRGPSGEGETLYMKAHRIPPTINDDKYWAMYSDPNKHPKLIAKNTAEIFATYGHLVPLRPGYLEAEQLVVPVVQGVFLGQTTAEKGMKSIAPQVQAVLDKSN